MKKPIKLLLLTLFAWPLLASGPARAADEPVCIHVGAVPQINLIAPDGGQQLQPGVPYAITYSVSGPASVKLSLSLDGGESFPIVISEAASGISHSWTVDDYDSQTARVKAEVTDNCGQAVAADVSAADFAILGSRQWTPPAVEVPTDGLTVSLRLSTPQADDQVRNTVLLQAVTSQPVDSVTFSLVASGADIPEAEVAAVSDNQELTWTGFLDSKKLANGRYRLKALALAGGQPVGRLEPLPLEIDNLILPEIKVTVTEPVSGSGVQGLLQINAMTDREADALDFVVRPRQGGDSAESALAYGLTGTNRLLWTTVFDTRKYADGPYLIKAKAYMLGQPVGESADIEVLFDNPAVDGIGVTLSRPYEGETLTGTVALTARTAERAGALDFVLTADSAAGSDSEPVIIKAIPDLEKRKWTALWESFTEPNGSYGLKAKAYVDSGLAGETPLVGVDVFNKLLLVGVDMDAPKHLQRIKGQLELLARTGEAVERAEFLIRPIDSPDWTPPIRLEAAPSEGNLSWSAAWDTVSELNGRYKVSVRAWYQGRSVGESAVADIFLENASTGATANTGLNLAERTAPAEDPTASGEYGREEALSSTPSINMDRGLLPLPEPEEPAEGEEEVEPPTQPGLILPPGTLFKSNESAAVYYYGRDGKRYVFPDSKTYHTWYGNFNNVQTVSPETLASIPLGGNVTYRPGARMVKITSDPKVYAVSRGGNLRWVKSEIVARRLYGTGWNKMIDDVSDAFFFNYRIGDPIEE